jgi:xylulose-5-phosphate/fructose-6-phosphate phosphoketolase
MDNLELAALYTGYGHQVRIVEYPSDKVTAEHDLEVNYNMAASLRWALEEIRKIQGAARSGKPLTKARPPMIVLRTPKGWTGPKVLNGNPIEGSWRAHQVPLPLAASDDNEFGLLEDWLQSYNPEELFHPDSDNLIDNVATRIIPKNPSHRMGQVKATYAGFTPLVSPDWKPFAHDKGKVVSNMKA